MEKNNLLIFCVLSFFVSVSSQLVSPCPEILNYEATDVKNQWQATLNLASEEELHGLWLRLMFNSTVKELKVDDNFGEVVPSSDNTQFLIKNRDFIVQAETPKILKITVTFDGDSAPSISTIRLNAKEICTSAIRFESLYLGDLNNKNFLDSVSPQKILTFKEFEGCGVAPLADKQYPWQASIYFRAQEVEKFICEAVLISPKHLLVPAHCVTYHKTQLSVPARILLVHFGNHENKKFIQVERIFVHPAYRFTQLFHDLSILQLKEAVIVDDEVRPICVDQSEINFDNDAFLVGFKDEKTLAQAKMEIIPEAECVKKNPKLQDLVIDNVYCFNYAEDIGSCFGSSGSSLIAARDASKKVWELKGIVTISASLQNLSVCNKGTDVLILDTENYIKWIQQTIS